MGGELDVDANAGEGDASTSAVENIYFDQPCHGKYAFWVDNYRQRHNDETESGVEQGDPAINKQHSTTFVAELKVKLF